MVLGALAVLLGLFISAAKPPAEPQQPLPRIHIVVTTQTVYET